MDKLNHLFIIPDGCRRWARRKYLAELYLKDKKEFLKALENLPENAVKDIEKRIAIFVKTGKDIFYELARDQINRPIDYLDLNIEVPRKYLLDAYEKGGTVFDEMIRWVLKNNVTNTLTIYALQRTNLNRPVDHIFATVKAQIERFKLWKKEKEYFKECTIKFVGDKNFFETSENSNNEEVKKLFDEYAKRSIELEDNFSGEKLKIFALAPYDPEWEINQAIDNGKFNPKKLIVSDVDCVIRGANEKRISNALPYQLRAAQFVSVSVYFPDFTIETFENALKFYIPKIRISGN